MIAHLVLFRPRAGLPEATRQNLTASFSRAVREIPSVRRARVGPRIAHGRPYEQLMRVDFSYAAVLEFDDLEGLKSYLEHPVHAELAARFFEASEETLIYDFELQDGVEALAADPARSRPE
jgi:hypothetical protein